MVQLAHLFLHTRRHATFTFLLLLLLLLLLLFLFFSDSPYGVLAEQRIGATQYHTRGCSAVSPSSLYRCPTVSSGAKDIDHNITLLHSQISAPNKNLQNKRPGSVYSIKDLDVGSSLQLHGSGDTRILSKLYLGRKSVPEMEVAQSNRFSSGWEKKRKRIQWGGFVPLSASEEEEEEEGGAIVGMMRSSSSPVVVVVEKTTTTTYDKYWCIARPWAEADVVQAALDWACGHTADCVPIQLAQPCYVPNTLLSHASFAFNSYFQIHGQATGTCDFGGAAMITNIDPSYPGCNYPFRAGQIGAPISSASSLGGALMLTTSLLLVSLSIQPML